MIITRWLTASHILKVTGNRGFWWVETRKSPGVVPPPTRLTGINTLVSVVSCYCSVT